MDDLMLCVYVRVPVCVSVSVCVVVLFSAFVFVGMTEFESM